MKTKVIIPPTHKGERLDVVLASLLNIPRAQVQKAIKENKVLLNDVPLKASYKVSGNEEVLFEYVEVGIKDLPPLDIALDIRYEDEYLLIVNKPSGLVVHPSFGHKSDTLVNALVARYQNLSDVSGEFRPGIVHRLDKETSGLLIVCKNNEVHNKIAALLKERKIERRYLALVKGSLEEDGGVIKTYLTRSKKNYQKMENTPATGKLAVTHFKVVERYTGYMLLELKLETGRTHQIRAHMEYLRTPVVGDLMYGTNNLKLYNKGQLLHSYAISFTHPYTKKEVHVTSELPPYFENVLQKLK